MDRKVIAGARQALARARGQEEEYSRNYYIKATFILQTSLPRWVGSEQGGVRPFW